jgi:hypothetical protein
MTSIVDADPPRGARQGDTALARRSVSRSLANFLGGVRDLFQELYKTPPGC